MTSVLDKEQGMPVAAEMQAERCSTGHIKLLARLRGARSLASDLALTAGQICRPTLLLLRIGNSPFVFWHREPRVEFSCFHVTDKPTLAEERLFTYKYKTVLKH